VDAFKDHLQTAHVRKFFGALARHSTTTARSLAQLAELDVP
jgi:quinol monooxygenase YgiN